MSWRPCTCTSACSYDAVSIMRNSLKSVFYMGYDAVKLVYCLPILLWANAMCTSISGTACVPLSRMGFCYTTCNWSESNASNSAEWAGMWAAQDKEGTTEVWGAEKLSPKCKFHCGELSLFLIHGLLCDFAPVLRIWTQYWRNRIAAFKCCASHAQYLLSSIQWFHLESVIDALMSHCWQHDAWKL